MQSLYHKTTAGLLVAFILGVGFLAPTTSADTDSNSEANATAGIDSSAESEATAGAETAAEVQTDTPSDAGATAIRGPLSNLAIHGFLSQAYATAKFAEEGTGPLGNEISIGIPEDGTTDYRKLALQFRYEISPRDIMIVQFSSRRLGDSPVDGVEDEIELDWAFYERRLWDHTSVKVGRVQLPFGIFNEFRDVGTILPFYRPPLALYGAGLFTSETVDGVVFSHAFAPQSDWSLETDFYYGEWKLIEVNPFAGGSAVVANAEDAYGFQLWLNTPVEGLRIGLGHNSVDITAGLEGIFRSIGEKVPRTTSLLSLEFAREKVVFRSEISRITDDESDLFFESEFDNFYLQLGYHFTEKIGLYIQTEGQTAKADKEAAIGPFGIPLTEDLDIDTITGHAVALNYLFSPNLVLKLEHHFDIGGDQLNIVPVAGPALQPVIQEAKNGTYTILSLSASF